MVALGGGVPVGSEEGHAADALSRGLARLQLNVLTILRTRCGLGIWGRHLSS